MTAHISTMTNPFSPSPRGAVVPDSNLVGREELLIDFWRLVDQASHGKLVPMIIRANYGGGKTTALKWLTTRLISKSDAPSHISSKRTFAVYTRLTHPRVSEAISSFVDGVKLGLGSQERSELRKAMAQATNIIREKGLQSEYASNCILYACCLDSLYSLGYEVIVHFIDEFEAIEELSPESVRGFLHEFRDFLDEVGERPLLLGIGCTDEAYRMMEDLHPALVSRVPAEFRKEADTRLQFTFENALEFVASKIEKIGSPNPEEANPYYPFRRDSIEYLYEKTKGNIRTIEQACYFAIEQFKVDNKPVTQDRIAKALHSVIKSKIGEEGTRHLLDLVDDPKKRYQVETKLKEGTPENLKTLVFDGVNVILQLQSFDYQLKFKDEILGETVGLSGIHTHAYRTVPLDLLFFCTSVPRDIGQSEIAECEKLRIQFRASLGMVLRLSQDSLLPVVSQSNLDVVVPMRAVEQLAVLPHVSRLDAERISRALDSELGLTRLIERWIKGKIEEGRIIGERFKQYEESIFLSLWEIGDDRVTIDRLVGHLKDRRISKTTVKSRLETLQEKSLVEMSEEKVRWRTSPLMKEILKIMTEEFQGKPVTTLDIRSYFAGGSNDILREYMNLMTRMGLFEEVRIAGRIAYKPQDAEALIQTAQKGLEAWKGRGHTSTEYPPALKSEIELKESLSHHSIEHAATMLKKDDRIMAVCAAHRTMKLVQDMEAILSSAEGNIMRLEKQYRDLTDRITAVREKLKNFPGQDISSLEHELDSILQRVKITYDSDFKVRGRQEQVQRALELAVKEIEEMDQFVSTTLEMSQKLTETLERTRQLVREIRSVDTHYRTVEAPEFLDEVERGLEEATALFNKQDFTRAEFVLLKILQNEGIRSVLQRINIRLSEIEANMNTLNESALSIARITKNIELPRLVQELRLLVAQAKETLSKEQLQKSSEIFDTIQTKANSLQDLMAKSLQDWANDTIPLNLPVSPREIAERKNIPIDLIVEGFEVLLRTGHLFVLRRD